MAPLSHKNRSDTPEEKLRLLRNALAAGNHEAAMSLAESIKDTVRWTRTTQGDPGQPVVAADAFTPVVTLAPSWAAWAEGWRFVKSLRLFEGGAGAREREAVDVLLSFRSDQVVDPRREVRVARVDPATGALTETPSQVLSDTRRGKERLCRLLFFAKVPHHSVANYLVFYGNPHAELPHYPSALSTRGEGYALDIENEHYEATLSRQHGQLERLRYKREHGLELYAGGKGHGEPPSIDWAHDYVDEGGFQKLRVKDWENCPNHEVIRGPLCVQVRRWGFPHGPLHPAFTPSRIHMDITYTFYAGLPYFFKESRFEALKDVQMGTLRDDEWVFSGYSFTRTLWMDARGRLREGPIPTTEAQNVWGVGFYHDQSRDAFIALWLSHDAENFDGKVRHGGSAMLHYFGHGQLWARVPAGGLLVKEGTAFTQRNAYLTSAYPEENAPALVEGLRQRLVQPVEVAVDSIPRLGNLPATAASTESRLARGGETASSAPLKNAIWETLRGVKDEQIYAADANIVDMGYVHDVRVRGGTVHVVISMPHPGRPIYDYLVFRGGGRVDDGIRERLLRLEGIDQVVVEPTWNPPWTAARASDAGRRVLGLA